MSVLQSIASVVYDALDSCFSWVVDIYDSFNISFVGIFFAMVVVTALARYILRPFIGYAAGQSDMAQNIRNERDYKEGMRRKSVQDRIY